MTSLDKTFQHGDDTRMVGEITVGLKSLGIVSASNLGLQGDGLLTAEFKEVPES